MKKLLLFILLLQTCLSAQVFQTKAPIFYPGQPGLRINVMLPNYGISSIGNYRLPYNIGYIDTVYVKNLKGVDSVTIKSIMSRQYLGSGYARFTSILPYNYSNIGNSKLPFANLWTDTSRAKVSYSDISFISAGLLKIGTIHPSAFGLSSFGSTKMPFNYGFVDTLNSKTVKVLGGSMVPSMSSINTGKPLDYSNTSYMNYLTSTERNRTVNVNDVKTNYKLEKKIVPRTGGVMVWHDDGMRVDYSTWAALYYKYKASATFSVVINSGLKYYDGASLHPFSDNSMDEGKLRIRGMLSAGMELGDHTILHQLALVHNFLDSLSTQYSASIHGEDQWHSALFYEPKYRKVADSLAHKYLGLSLGWNAYPIDSTGGIFQNLGSRANYAIWDRTFQIIKLWWLDNVGYMPSYWSQPGSGFRNATAYYDNSGLYDPYFYSIRNPKTGETWYDMLVKYGYKTTQQDRSYTTGYFFHTYQINGFLSQPNGLWANYDHHGSIVSDNVQLLSGAFTSKSSIYDADTTMKNIFRRIVTDYAQGRYHILGWDNFTDSTRKIVAMEYILKFCLENKIPVVSFEEAYKNCWDSKTNEYENVIPNPEFKQTLKTSLGTSDTVANYPDGWCQTLNRDTYTFDSSAPPIVETDPDVPDGSSKVLTLGASNSIATSLRGLYPGKYKLTYWVKSKSGTDAATTNIYVAKNSDSYSGLGTLDENETYSVGTGWTKKTYYFIVPDAAITKDALHGGSSDIRYVGYQDKIACANLKIDTGANSSDMSFALFDCRKMRADEL